MNLVELIKGLLSGEVLSKLSGLLGIGEDKTKTAVGAAVPSLLSGISSLASTPEGAEKVTRAMGGLDTGMLSNLGGILSGGGGGMLDKGKDMLGSLFGGGLMSGLGGVLSKHLGLGEGIVNKLLGFLGPVVLGGIMKGAGGKVPSAAGLTDMLSSQKANIMNALPSGLNLGSIPGMGTARAAVGAAADATNNIARWVILLLGVLAIALVLWWLFIREKGTSTPTAPTTPAGVTVPDVGVLSGDVTGSLTKLNETLTGIKDAASAEAALPKLNEVNTSLDSVKARWEKLPTAAQSTVSTLVKDKLGSVKDLITKILAMTGLSDKVKPVLDGILYKLTGMAG